MERRVLIVDDDSDSGPLLEGYLREVGFETRALTAPNTSLSAL